MRGAVESLTLAAAIALLLGCSGAQGRKVVAGEKCSKSQLGEVICGVAGTEVTFGQEAHPADQEVVLKCVIRGNEYVWALEERCDGTCIDGVCVSPFSSDVSWGSADRAGNVADGWSGASEEVRSGSFETKSKEEIFVCDPGSIGCADDFTVKVCNLTGTGWDYKPCGAGEGCDLGYCKEQICTPWELEGKCVGPTAYSRCSGSGTRWEVGYCEFPNKCYMGTCIDVVCIEGSVECKGLTAVQECVATPDGKNKWEVTEICKGGLCKEGKCISACEVSLKDNTYIGCEYWAVDLDNVEGGQYEPVAVVVSVPSDQQGSATITITNMATNPPTELTPEELGVPDMVVEPGQLEKFFLPTGFDIDGSVLTNKTFQIVSTAPVTVHQFNPFNGENIFTNDASLLLPAHVGGHEYLIMAWPQRTESFTLRGMATVIATQEGTTKVDVWPTCNILGGNNVPSMAAYPPAPYTFYLEMGDVLNLETDGAQGADLTGTRIVADKKVAVFGGHECANIPLGVNYCDHIEQQLYPVSAWGTHYIADAFAKRSPSQKDIWRILAGADNVQVTLNPKVAGPYVLNKMQWVEFSSGESFEVIGTGPILLGHFLSGSNYQGANWTCGNTGIGDPAFTLGVPVEQFLAEYIVLTPPTYQEDYINITAKLEKAGSITIDGAPLSVPLTPVGTSGWGVAQVPVSDGVHTLVGAQPFGVTAYGYDCDVSYAYPGGLSLKTIY